MKKILCMLLVSVGPVFAQQQPANPDVQACHSILFERMTRDLEVRSQAFRFQQQVTKLTADLKAMKDKYEPEKKPEEKK